MADTLFGEDFEGPYSSKALGEMIGYTTKQLRVWVDERTIPDGIRVLQTTRGAPLRWFLNREVFLAACEIKTDHPREETYVDHMGRKVAVNIPEVDVYGRVVQGTVKKVSTEFEESEDDIYADFDPPGMDTEY